MAKAETAVTARLYPLASLAPNQSNARTHPEEQVAQIASSIREFGFTNPILADLSAGGVIVAGHGRRLAMLQLVEAGATVRLPGGRVLPRGKVPVIDCSGWSEAQRRAYTLADNRLAETSEWDSDLLRIELQFLESEGFDLEFTGFDERALARALVSPGGGLTDPEEMPEPEAVKVSRTGDVWVLGRHRIVCGDSTDAETVKLLLGGERPHLMVTDPPYGVKYDASWRDGVGAY